MNHNRKARRYHGLTCGIIMAVFGAYMLGVKLGYIPENFLSGVPFFPLALLVFGALIIYHAIAGRNKGGESNQGTGTCC